jgi:hypothetical protein
LGRQYVPCFIAEFCGGAEIILENLLPHGIKTPSLMICRKNKQFNLAAHFDSSPSARPALRET